MSQPDQSKVLFALSTFTVADPASFSGTRTVLLGEMVATDDPIVTAYPGSFVEFAAPALTVEDL